MTIKTRKSATADTGKTPSRARKPAAAKVAQTKQADIVDAVQTPSTVPDQPQDVALEGLDRPVTGRGVFAVRTLGTAVSVEAAFLEENGNVLRLPAVFPNRQYALAQLEELWQLVNQHFEDIEQAGKGAGE